MPILPQQMGAGAAQDAQPQAQAPSQIDQLREALIPEILKSLRQPQQQPPLYQPQPVSPVQGYAMARNPDQAGMLMNQIQAPAQARYQQQLMAFQEAMGGQKEAMQYGTTLAGQASREDIAKAAMAQRQGQEDILNQIRLLGLGIREQQAGKQSPFQAVQTPTGPVAWDPRNPTAPAPAITQQGPGGQATPIPGKPNLQVTQALSTLGDLKQTYADMKELYRAGHGYRLNTQTRQIERVSGQPSDVLVHGAGGGGVLVHPTAESRTRQILSGWATRPGFSRGALSGLMPGAATHEELRAKTIPEMLRPLSGQSRAMASLMEQFQHFLPDWTTAPEAAEPAFASADAMIERAERDLKTSFPASAQTSSGGSLDALAAKAARGERLTPDEMRTLDAGLSAAGH